MGIESEEERRYDVLLRQDSWMRAQPWREQLCQAPQFDGLSGGRWSAGGGACRSCHQLPVDLAV
ncbi:MAG: hypothetical protein R2911_28350 [Caldilineaceae bacterium]